MAREFGKRGALAGVGKPGYQHVKTSAQEVVYSKGIDQQMVEHFVFDPESVLQDGYSRLLKGDSTSEKSVYRVEMNRKSYIVKRFQSEAKGKRWKHLIRHSRAHLAWNQGVAAAEHQFNAPKPYLFLEQADRNSPKVSYIVMEAIEGVSLREFMENHPDPSLYVRGVVHQVVDILKEMEGARMVHGDLHAGNFLVDRRGKVHLIDFDHSRQYQQGALFYQNVHRKECKKLLDCFDSNPVQYGLIEQLVNAVE
ncbi:MAG: hypothetical protein S4CHLAM102_13620 [Chlamydiia bacterium]|nr:hypothetical protein [Chlamydiia bacterium]